jgi:hypothetical protein
MKRKMFNVKSEIKGKSPVHVVFLSKITAVKYLTRRRYVIVTGSGACTEKIIARNSLRKHFWSALASSLQSTEHK